MPWNDTEKSSQHAPKERLAVLPFVNISPDPNDEFFADGLTEEMITKLSEVGGLKVIARTSVMNYKKKEKKVADIGKELGVGSIVEGSVRKSGSKIRVTVQLVDAHTEEHLWASNYDKELDDIFAIQSDIASKVANSLSRRIFKVEGERDTDDIEAYTFYLRGMQLFHERTEQSLREALDLLSKAVSRDQGFARAHAAIAQTWVLMAVLGHEDYSVIVDRGEVAAKKAIELAPELAEGHAAMAQVHWTLDRFNECVSEVEKAVELNPNLADSYFSLATAKAAMGMLTEGLKAGEKALELDPLSTRIMSQLAWIYRCARRYNDALALLRKMMQLDPRNVRTYHGFVDHYLWIGDYARARDMLEKASEMSAGDPLIRLDQGLLDALTGRTKEAHEVIKLLRAERKKSVQTYSLLFMHAALGELDEAFKDLMQTAVIHSWPAYIKYSPIFSEMRKDQRFQEFCRAVGIPP
jgi:TolB-like protein/Flp pilus assembly protein TadD